MSHAYQATVIWKAGKGEPFASRHYSRAHNWKFDGGIDVPASASPLVVPAPLSEAAAVDPEEALVASLASCHMLFFLDMASRKGLDILSYEDNAVGEMDKRADGKTAMVRATLKPRVVFAGTADAELVEQLHHRAHELCYIANSVNFPVTVEPQP
ncbi:MAG: OsmC family protein [Sphingobium sp.]